MHLHVLGIGGTFMAGMARLAVELGHEVTGSDQALYPPMSTQLEALGIRVFEGYDPAALDPAPDLVVVGNALSRGNPCVEHILSNDLPYASGPEWLERHVLPGRHVIAIAGTHGKTTTTSLTAWLLEATGLAPGFLIGGVAENFGVSARLGSGKAFVIEADEYDTAFFDKRSKFVHYHPRTLVINNLEFDHADIFDDLGAIQRQFHHLVRTMPAEARILRPAPYPAIDEVLERGVWSAVETFGTDAACDWRFRWAAGDPATFALEGPGGVACGSTTPLMGLHNAWNTAAAIAAAASVGVAPGLAAAALPDFASVRRRLELRGRPHGISVYDDFAHHPTAIAATIGALRATVDRGRVLAVLEPRSNTMVMGVHKDTLARSVEGADRVYILLPPELHWDIRQAMAANEQVRLFTDSEDLLRAVTGDAREGDHVLIMSNGAFAGIHERIIDRLEQT